MSVRLRLIIVLGSLILILSGVIYTSVTSLQSSALDAVELNSAGLLGIYTAQIETLADSVVETDVRTDEIRLSIQSLLGTVGQLGSSIRQFYASSDFVSRADFTAYLSNLAQDYPAITSIGYVPRVTRAGRFAFESAVAAEDFSNFVIKNADETGQMVTAGEREVYYPANYIVPFEPNASSFGFDLGSIPLQLAGLEQARDTGQLVATQAFAVAASSGGDASYGVLVLIPIYRNNVDLATVENRRLNLQGFVAMNVNITSLINQSLGNLNRLTEVVRLDDVTSGATTVLYENSASNLNTDITATLPLEAFGRNWRLTVTGVIDRTQTLAELPQIMNELDTRVNALLDGAPELNLYGLRRYENDALLLAYDRLLTSKNALAENVSNFITSTTDNQRAEYLPSIQNFVQITLDDTNVLLDLVVQEQQENANQAVQGALLVSVAAALVVLFGLVTIYQIIRNVSNVNTTARKLEQGDLSARVDNPGTDEIGQIGQALNNMAGELENVVSTLEDRIATRTRDLETVADVNTQISTILESDRLLQDVADLTKERFHLYHSHIYLFDGQKLLLTAGAGHVGRQMVAEDRTITLENQQSIVANAARGRKGIIINDVQQSSTFLAHPLLPDTRAELAMPLIARGQLLGVLDVQSDQVNFFSREMYSVIELMAGQVATALSNAQLYEVAERTSRHERALGAIDRRIQNAVDMDEILQMTVRELGKALRVPYTAIELQLDGQPEE